MPHYREKLAVETRGRGTYDLTERVQRAVLASGIREGLCTVFVHHTSASVIVCENADPSVRTDLEAFLSRLVPDGDRLFTHTAEGVDDMPSHVRSILTQTSIGIPVEGGRCDLGTWQGIYLYEHRRAPHRRTVSVTVTG
ncbi:MAG: YjbQ family protein [Sandaracinaceae bacterium]|nr:YjbQ family protein [Sandaracinaceae bacterium]